MPCPMPSHTTISVCDEIDKLYEETHERVEKLIAENLSGMAIPAFVFTTDIWSSSAQDSYISFTISFIDFSKLTALTLENRPFPGSHTADAVLTVIKSMMEDWNLPSSGITLLAIHIRSNKLHDSANL